MSLLSGQLVSYSLSMSGLPAIREILDTRLLPWVTNNGPERLIVAQPRLREMKAATQLPLIPKKLKGPRKRVRAFTFNDVKALWPNDNLLETDNALLIFVLKGEGDLNCGDYVLHLPEGNAMLVPGRVPRWTGVEDLEYLGDNPNRYSDIIFFREARGSMQVWSSSRRGNRHIYHSLNDMLMIHNTRLIRLLEEMQEEVTTCRPHFEMMTWGLLEQFLLTLHRDLLEDKAIYPARLVGGENILTNGEAPIQRAQQYVREHLNEELTQDKMARRVYLSRTQFISRFHAETGQTFNEFVTRCRIEQAKKLLEQTDFPLTFIHFSVGYKSPTYFNTVFRKHTGILPSQYRLAKKTDKASG